LPVNKPIARNRLIDIKRVFPVGNIIPTRPRTNAWNAVKMVTLVGSMH